MSTMEKRDILELLESGKIDAEEAARLLSGAKTNVSPIEKQPEDAVAPAEPVSAGDKPSMFRVRVRNLETGENKVSVNIPLRMFKLGMKLGGRFSPHLEGIPMAELNEMMTGMEKGMLVEVQDEVSQEHVQVYLD